MNTELIDKAIDERKGIWGGKPGNDYLYKLSHQVNSFSYASGRLEYHGQDFICTRDEFEARVAERQGKPSWGDVADGIVYITQDSDGVWVGHLKKARNRKGYEGWTSDSQQFILSKGGIGGEVIIPWQDTLEARPVEKAGFVDGDWVDSAGLTIEQLKAVAAVAGKVFDDKRPPLPGDAIVFRGGYNYLQYECKPSRGTEYTLSEWLLKTVPDSCDKIRFNDGVIYYQIGSDVISPKNYEMLGRHDGPYSDLIEHSQYKYKWEVIATREPATPKSPVQITDDGISVLGEKIAEFGPKAELKVSNPNVTISGDSTKQPYMPEVGDKTVLESIGASVINHEVIITYIGDGVGCYKDLTNGAEYTYAQLDTKFRPIQSEKEKFVQAAMEINNRMIDADMNDTSLIFGAVFEELVDKPT